MPLHRNVGRVVGWRFAVLLLVAAAVGVAGAKLTLGADSPHPAALDRPAKTGDAMSSDARGYLNLAVGDSRKVGSWADSAGSTRDLFVATSKGLPSNPSYPVTCLELSGPEGGTGGGCNPAGNFFMGQSLVWSSMSITDPKTGKTQTFLVGVATAQVATVDVADSAGHVTNLPVTADGGLFYEVPAADQAAGVKPTALVTHGSDGRVVDRIPVE